MRIIKYLSATILVLLVAGAGVVYLLKVSRTSIVMVDNASLVEVDTLGLLEENMALFNAAGDETWDSWCQSCVELLLGGHRMREGRHMVFRHAWRDPGKFWHTDTGLYRVLSIEVSRDLLGKTVPINSSGVRYYFSRGGTHWADKCSGSIAKSALGRVRIDSMYNGLYRVSMDIVFEGVHLREHRAIEDVMINETVIATAWPLSEVDDSAYGFWMSLYRE